MLKWLLLFYCSLYATCINAQQEGEPGITLKQYNKSTDNKEKVELLVRLGRYYLYKEGEYKSDLDSALLMTNRAIALSHNIKYEKGVDDATAVKGTIYTESKNYEEVNRLLADNLHDSVRLTIMMDLVRYYCNTPGRTKREEDSAILYGSRVLHIGESMHVTTFKIECLAFMAICTYSQGDIEHAKQYSIQYLNSFQSANMEEKAFGLAAMPSFIYSDEKLYKEFLSVREQIIRDYKNLEGKQQEAIRERLAFTFYVCALNDYHEGLHGDAERDFLQSIELGKMSNPIEMNPYQYLTKMYVLDGKTNIALTYAIKALKIIEKEGLAEKEERPYLSLMTIYYEMGDYLKCIEYGKKVMSILDKQSEKKLGGATFKFTAKSYINLKRPEEALSFMIKNKDKITSVNTQQQIFDEAFGDCYFSLSQYSNAEKWYLKGLKEVYDIKDLRFNGFEPLGKLYLKTKQYEKARYYLNPLVADSNKKTVGLIIQRNAHNYLFQIDSGFGNYMSAIEHLQKLKELDDSINADIRKKQTEELKIQFETSKKDQDIQLKAKDIDLLNKEKKIQAASLRDANTTRNIIILASTLLMTLLVARYKIKQRHNTELQNQQLEINKQNNLLKDAVAEQQKLLSEKEWLVKEIHHRVKNNLQIVVSLLNTQAAHLEEGDALMAIQESRHRMQVISLLHQKLYQAETSSLIDMQVYISEVVSYLKDSFKGINHLYFSQQIDAISLDISQAVPVGLILNEAITNCIKYAFPKNINGSITIIITKEDDGRLLLIVADNGVGIKEDIDPAQRNSLGMRLMLTLSEQLDGNMKIENKEGTIVKVCFRPQVIEQKRETTESIKNIELIIP